jgi:protein-S-isoprenylcysteine O-methyltransferase Ste14
MDAMTFTRIALPVAMLLFVVVGIALPVVRLRVRHGAWGLTGLSRRDPLERGIVVAMALLIAATLVWGGLYGALGPRALGVWAAPDAVSWAGWTLAAAGFLLVIAAQAQMGASWRIGIDAQPTRLVTDGVFTWVRNPIFTGMIVAAGGVALVSPSPWTLAGAALTTLAIALQVRLEERHLLAQHGVVYRAYAQRVGRFVPFVGRLDGADRG